jgi:Concanavalin A-like lectin/glucanases superfamily
VVLALGHWTYGAPGNVQSGTLPLLTGLRAWWKVLPLMGGGATWADLMGRAPQTLVGLLPSSLSSGFGATERPGGLGELRFPGTASVYARSAAVSLGLGQAQALSCAGWVRMTTLSAVQRLFHKEIADGWNTFAMEVSATGVPRFSVQSEPQVVYPAWDMPTALSVGWSHVAATWAPRTFTGADVALYLNAVAQAATYAANGYTSAFLVQEVALPLYLGIRPVTLTQPLSGAMDDVMVWNRALAPSEVADVYQASRLGWPGTLTRAGSMLAFLPPAAGLLLPHMMQHGA